MVRGGAESLILEHIRHAGPGVESLVCALNRSGPSLEIAASLGARTRLLGKGANHLEGLRQLTSLMREWRVEVVNGHNPTGALYATPAARWADVPVVFRSEHSIHYPGRHSRVYPPIEAVLTAMTQRVLCVCDTARESHSRRLPWARSKFVTVYPGISDAPPLRPREELRRALGLSPDSIAVVSVGSLTRQKAQHVLIEAFARVAGRNPRAMLVIGGDGPLRSTLEADVAARGLTGRIRLLGPFAEDVAELVEASDLFALSSVREGMPITVLEAMRGAKAVVSTRAGGVSEAVVDGETGRLVDVGDAAALGEALHDALSDPARRAAWGEAGRRRWVERFRAERTVRETEALYAAELRS
jgi:glycosyltransferase involved in cell wall biosynthesis